LDAPAARHERRAVLTQGEVMTRLFDEPRSVPIADVKVGDIVRHVGLIVGTDWRTIVTGLETAADGTVTVYSTHWPLLAADAVAPRSMMQVDGHSDDDVALALRMFGADA
jgi:hypothetical protein